MDSQAQPCVSDASVQWTAWSRPAYTAQLDIACRADVPVRREGIRADDEVFNVGRRQGGQEVLDVLVGHADRRSRRGGGSARGARRSARWA